MPEFILRDSIEDEKLTAVSTDRYAANMALLRYLTERGFQICVLKRWLPCKPGRGFMHDHFIGVGDQNRCAAWIQEALQKAAEKGEEITIEIV